MATHPKIQLSRLRQIGWALWDPIGLGNDDGTWSEDCADEYDRYLLHVVSLICNGRPVSEGGAYLVHIASEHMGLSHVDAAAAAATSGAIAAYLASCQIVQLLSAKRAASLRVPIPWQQVAKATGRAFRDPHEDIGEPSLGGDVAKPRRLCRLANYAER